MALTARLRGTSLHGFNCLSVIAILCAMIAVRDLMGMQINKFVFVLLYILACCWLNQDGIIKLLGFSIPLLNGLPNTYIILIITLVIIYKFRMQFDFRLFAIPLMLAAQELLHALLYSRVDVIQEASFVATLFLFVLISTVGKEKAENLLFYFVIGTAFSQGIVILGAMHELGSDVLFSGSVRLGFDAGGLAESALEGIRLRFNPNEIGYYSVVALSGALLLYYRIRRGKAVLVFCMVICIVAGVLSQSRTWLLLSVPVCVAQLILGFRTVVGARKSMVIIVVCLGVVGVFIIHNPQVAQSIVARFQDSSLATGGGRTGIFTDYTEYIFSDFARFVFGTGVVDYKGVTGISMSMHNGLQQIVVCLGLVGAIAFIGLVAALVRRSISGRAVGLSELLPLAASIAFTQSIQLLNPWVLMLPVACGIAAIGLSREKGRAAQSRRVTCRC